MKNKKKRSSGGKTAMVVLCVCLGLILTVLLGVTIYAQRLLNRINYINPGDQETMSPEEVSEYLATEETDPVGTEPTMNEADVDWGDEGNDSEIGKEDHIINILLIGQDARPGEKRTRSDVMILCTINKDTKTLVMTSFLRDLYVRIPGYNSNKMNSAYAWGGMELLDATMEKNFGVHVDGNVEVNFEQFSDIIDTLGGVEIELRRDEAQLINSVVKGSKLTAGVQRLNGDQALFYSRIRALDRDADFSRTNRQRKVLDSLIQEFKNADMATILDLLEQVMPMITTDMTPEEIISYATEVFPMLSSATIVSQSIPVKGKYKDARIDGRAVLVADMNANREFLQKTLLGG